MGVEPTTLAAKDRINGFEGHEDHRTPFASVSNAELYQHLQSYERTRLVGELFRHMEVERG